MDLYDKILEFIKDEEAHKRKCKVYDDVIGLYYDIAPFHIFSEVREEIANH